MDFKPNFPLSTTVLQRYIGDGAGSAPVCEHVGQAESVVILLGENLEKFFHVVVPGKPVKHGVQ